MVGGEECGGCHVHSPPSATQKSYTDSPSGMLQSCQRDMRLRLAHSGIRLVVGALVLLLLTTTVLAQRQGLRIIPLVRDNQVLVTFELADGFTDEVRAAILSGLQTTFTYTVDLRLEVPLWLDGTMATTVVSNSVEYDNLTRQHSVVRMVDGRIDRTQITEDEALVRELMTSFQRLPLFRTSILEPNREYYVRVSAVARPSNGAFLWPWGSGTSGQAKFTFVP